MIAGAFPLPAPWSPYSGMAPLEERRRPTTDGSARQERGTPVRTVAPSTPEPPRSARSRDESNRPG
jgi:hypothetical protein